MILKPAPPAYDQADQAQLREALRRAQAETFKSGRDIELVRGQRIILTSPDGSQFSLVVDNAGTLSAFPV